MPHQGSTTAVRLHLVETAIGSRLRVRVVPRARRTAVAGLRGDALLCRLTASPVDGAANAALTNLLAGVLSVSRRAIRIVNGARARTKEVTVEGLSPDAVSNRLEPYL